MIPSLLRSLLGSRHIFPAGLGALASKDPMPARALPALPGVAPEASALAPLREHDGGPRLLHRGR